MQGENRFGLMELNHRELLAYGIGKKNLTSLELELLLRFEQLLDARDQFVSNAVQLPCAKCVTFASLLPEEGVAGEISLQAKIVPWQ